jgi:polysaccharide biosynthesis transport protein
VLLETRGEEPEASTGGTQDNQIAQLELQLKDIEFSVARLNRNQETVLGQIARVQQWVETTPVRETEWAALTRDYSQLQQHYQTLVSRNLEAESAELLERRQKGSQFRIVESAYLPRKPFKPDFGKFMLMATAFGLGLGFVLAYGLEFTNTSFRDVNDLESYLGLPVTCAIPKLETAGEKKRVLLRNIAWAIGLGLGFAALGGGMLFLWQRGMIIL